MTPMNEEMLNAIRMKCLDYPTDHPIKRSSNVAFRDIFDPYCAEYQGLTHEGRMAVLREMMEKGIITSVLLFYKCFMDLFNGHKRPDIANSAADGMALLLDYVLIGGNNDRAE